jgi:alkylation response protein AidB-like acyl-CoA dehydrogenase
VAEPSTDGRELVLSGTKILVPDGSVATLFLVVARVGEGLAFLPVAADAAGLTVTPMQRIDGDDVAELRFAEVRVPVSAVLGGAAAEALVRSTYDRWTVLLAANLLGDAEAVLHQTNEYARQRVQFGRPIGSFQAVSHRLADVLVAVEIGRSLCYAACLRLDEGHEQAGLFASAAKAWMSEAAVDAAEAALQLHGGIGYTWELDVHLHLRRARANAVSLGDAAWHRERIARQLAARYQS